MSSPPTIALYYPHHIPSADGAQQDKVNMEVGDRSDVKAAANPGKKRSRPKEGRQSVAGISEQKRPSFPDGGNMENLKVQKRRDLSPYPPRLNFAFVYINMLTPEIP